MKSSRLIAFEVLHKIFYDDAYSNLTLDKALKDVNENKPFISALVYGVVERKLTLDYYINKYVKSKPKPKIMTILRLGAFQLKFMDKVPSSAAINESVNLTKDIKQDYYSKLVNAVLHKIDEDDEIIDDLSIKYSVPLNLVNMWYKQYGEEVVNGFLPCINSVPPIFAVPNVKYLDSDELLYELMLENVDCEKSNDMVKINSNFDIRSSKAYINGLFHIQDKSAYECSKLLVDDSDGIILDVCAAPGGKSFTIAQRCPNSKVYSFDLYEHRVGLIKDGIIRLGLENIVAQVNDATVYSDKIPMADKIICDVVCSGFGTIRRKPEIKYKNLDDIKSLPLLQMNILQTSSRYLKNNGTIIYSTCTLNKKENEKVVNNFLENNSDFKLIEQKTVFPNADGGDGFYWAVIKKNEN